MIAAGRMDPRYSMRLWVQAMRALAERHRENVVFGCLTPEAIAVDMENNVRIEAPAARRAPYVSPEVEAGLPPDRQADIYSMGVILHELVTGGTDQLGRRRAGEIVPDVPPWLDDLIGRCTEKNLTRRFRTAEEVSAALLKLKTPPWVSGDAGCGGPSLPTRDLDHPQPRERSPRKDMARGLGRHEIGSRAERPLPTLPAACHYSDSLGSNASRRPSPSML